MDSSQQTLRLSGLPSLTQESDVRHFFEQRVERRHGRQIIESVGPICDHGNRETKRTTVSFSSHNVAKKAIDLPLSNRRFGAERGGASHVTLDATFQDLTTLHQQNNPTTGKPDIDIVALHGLSGHAWNSFTTFRVYDQTAGRIKETNWLRDTLPRLLEQDQRHKIYSRVMVFGYNADVWMTNSVADIDVPINNLITYLEIERSNDPRRPLFFIGHSLGGIVVKQAIVNLANDALRKTLMDSPSSAQGYNFPVKGLMLFGVPNKGSELADTASGILSLLNTVFNVNPRVVRDLEYKSQQLANIATEFRSIRHQQNIPVISFFETQKYSKALGVIVNQDSAVISYDGGPRPFGVDRNHKEMVRFTDDDAHALEPAVEFLAQIAHRAVVAQMSRPGPRPLTQGSPSMTSPPLSSPDIAVDGRSQEKVNKWSKLKTYDTVFLIDDSPSMAGGKWDLVKEILDCSTKIAAKHDPDGIEMHFLNNIDSNRDNIKDPAIATRIHHEIVLDGTTPLLDQLTRHLDHYLYKFKQNRGTLNFKGLNLIILTDGEPDPESEDESDISDQEDAKNTSPVYRLTRKKIVEIARELDEAKAAKNQVGIQFCQIGNEDNVEAFFKYLDDKIKGAFKLKRDMVDTVRCLSFQYLTEDFYEKLLMGSFNKSLDHAEHHRSTSNEANKHATIQQALPPTRNSAFVPTIPHQPQNTFETSSGDTDENFGEDPSMGYDSFSQDRQRLSQNYTLISAQGQLPQRVPSPRSLTLGTNEPPPQQMSRANRSATEAVGRPKNKNFLPWRS